MVPLTLMESDAPEMSGRSALSVRIAEFVEQTNRASSPEELFAQLVDVAGYFGCEYLAYGALCIDRHAGPEPDTAPALLLNYPPGWQAYYFEQGYQTLDPVVTRTIYAAGPYVWNDWRRGRLLSKEEDQVFADAADAGLRIGASIPLHGALGRVSVLSFASGRSRMDFRDHLRWLHTIAAQFHIAYDQIASTDCRQSQQPALTRREKECLTWVAHGKSSWDISMILKLSESTVQFHLQNVLRKLATSSRTVAVVKAIRLGLIIV
jgi:DNA-binding CsgD family transcriptional regulator